jgi:hypothetical protein
VKMMHCFTVILNNREVTRGKNFTRNYMYNTAHEPSEFEHSVEKSILFMMTETSC